MTDEHETRAIQLREWFERRCEIMKLSTETIAWIEARAAESLEPWALFVPRLLEQIDRAQSGPRDVPWASTPPAGTTIRGLLIEVVTACDAGSPRRLTGIRLRSNAELDWLKARLKRGTGAPLFNGVPIIVDHTMPPGWVRITRQDGTHEDVSIQWSPWRGGVELSHDPED